jgi:large repetitive protein
MRRRRRRARRARSLGGRLLAVAVSTIAATALGPANSALAAPALTITSPAGGSVISTPTPTFGGTTGYSDFEEFPLGVINHVTVVIRDSSGAQVQAPLSMITQFQEPTWSVGHAGTLPAGTYTAHAEMCEEFLGEPGCIGPKTTSLPVTFTIDTAPPVVTITSPADGSSTTSTSPILSGSAETAADDLPTITVQLFSGSTTGSQAPVETLKIPSSGGSWSATLGGLGLGTYTARAEQEDEAGNLGTSAPVTFTVTTPPPPPAPTAPLASFKWFPAAPHVGEHVSLISNSTDDTSPITAYAWSLGTSGLFTAGTQVLSTSFPTPGDHVVRLSVTAADGLSSLATETIHVSPTALTLMAPFPIVRIAGNVTSSGVSLSLLTVQAPVGARVKVTCHGGGCPAAPESRLAASRGKKARATTVMIAFRRFQRSLAAGAVLEIRIFKQGVIGKYTRFVIRRGRLPIRVDTCLGQAGIKPMPCPTS